MTILHNQFSDNGKPGNNEDVLYTLYAQLLHTNWINFFFAKHRPHSVGFVLAWKKPTRNKEATTVFALSDSIQKYKV